MTGSELDAQVFAIVQEAAKQGRRVTISDVQTQTGAARSSIFRVAAHYGYRNWLDFTSSLERYYSRALQKDMVVQGIEAVTSAILRNRKLPILVDSVGDAAICATYLQYRLSEQGYMSLSYAEGVARSWGTAMGGGLVFVINESGTSLLPTCLTAVQHGFETVSITSSHDTPVSKVCDVNVVIKSSKSPLSSYKPNYFTAGTLSFIERVLQRLTMDAPD